MAMPNLLSVLPVLIYLCVFAETSGFTRDGNRRTLVQRFGNLVNRAQFLLRFDIEAEDLAPQSVLDLFATFSDAGKGTLRWIASGLDDPIKFAAGNDVKPGALIGEETNDGEIRICFDRVADLVMQLVQRLIEPLIVIHNSLRTVDIQRVCQTARRLCREDTIRRSVCLADNEMSA